MFDLHIKLNQLRNLNLLLPLFPISKGFLYHNVHLSNVCCLISRCLFQHLLGEKYPNFTAKTNYWHSFEVRILHLHFRYTVLKY